MPLLVVVEIVHALRELGVAQANALTPTTAATTTATAVASCIAASRFPVVVRLLFWCFAIRVALVGGVNRLCQQLLVRWGPRCSPQHFPFLTEISRASVTPS